MRIRRIWIYCVALIFILSPAILFGQDTKSQNKKKKKKAPRPFQWVNPLSKNDKQRVSQIQHSTFQSPTLGVEIGYCFYLPSEYQNDGFKDKRYPVVYYLHGGRPGSEKKSIRLVNEIHKHIEAGDVPPMIYIFVNGGPVSHYNLPDKKEAQGADVFIKELIPHVDKTYRTIADRSGRGLEGFSQGGRGTARLMFRYPDLFCSASPGGGGHATEKRISESGGFENPNLRFVKGDNTWDLATAYSQRRNQSKTLDRVAILVHVGDKGFNYQNNLQWMKHLESLGIAHEKTIVPGVGHSAMEIYQQKGREIMKFHATNFGLIQK
ncbi:MAG: alpha/beta hydrolase-fold protein [Planctomycetota bacterium]